MTGSGQKVDQVISLRFPAYAVRHPNHVCWLVHTMREYYDGWERFSSQLSPQGRAKELTRRTLIRAADTYFLKRVRRLYTISQVVSDRLTTWNHVKSEALHPPPPTVWVELVDCLSDRERDVLALMVAGLDRRQIADELMISFNTVRTHVKHVLSKLGAHSTVEAISVALRAGIRPPDLGSKR